MKTKQILLPFVLLTLLLLGACKPSAPQSTLVYTHTPTEPLVAAETNTQKPANTPLPPAATSTAPTIPEPTSLNANGPYVIFEGEGGIWITNPDRSFPTRISPYEVRSDLRRAISPTGNTIVLVIRTDEGLDLVIVKIPGGEMETIT
ncbi:MAG: hypothetical protein J7L73_02100, partial [Anaerolineales bacterium]|nr:hypothetical protein [Anaerolineales bacterium]